jgi:hypothetical protein
MQKKNEKSETYLHIYIIYLFLFVNWLYCRFNYILHFILSLSPAANIIELLLSLIWSEIELNNDNENKKLFLSLDYPSHSITHPPPPLQSSFTKLKKEGWKIKKHRNLINGIRVVELVDWVIHFIKTAKSTRGFIIASQHTNNWVYSTIHTHVLYHSACCCCCFWGIRHMVIAIWRSDKYLLFNYCRWWLRVITLKRRQDKGFSENIFKACWESEREQARCDKNLKWCVNKKRRVWDVNNLNWKSMLETLVAHKKSWFY